jgi:hypothetical protein
VSQQELYLFEIPTALTAEHGAGTTEVMGAEVLDPDLNARERIRRNRRAAH